MTPNPKTADAEIARAAGLWTVRRDRGLSATESIEFELWLAADPRHAVAIKRSEAAWTVLDRIPERTAVMFTSSERRNRWARGKWILAATAAAILVSLTGIAIAPRITSGPTASLVATGPRSVTLEDGSLVWLKNNSEIIEEFTVRERRVRLTRGEAHFTVAPNPQRPFVVIAGPLHVSAIGTAFNVSLERPGVEVIVTHGTVQLATDTLRTAAPKAIAGQRAILAATTNARDAEAKIVVTQADVADIARALSWQGSLLKLGGSTLAEIAAEFERRSGRHIILADPALARLRVGGRFRADDLAGFVSLLATTFDVEVENRTDGSLVLRKKNAISQ
jgi:transmembrane sensor